MHITEAVQVRVSDRGSSSLISLFTAVLEVMEQSVV